MIIISLSTIFWALVIYYWGPIIFLVIIKILRALFNGLNALIDKLNALIALIALVTAKNAGVFCRYIMVEAVVLCRYTLFIIRSLPRRILTWFLRDVLTARLLGLLGMSVFGFILFAGAAVLSRENSLNTQNTQNCDVQRNGKLVGAVFNKPTQKWQSQIRINRTGKIQYLGFYETEELAHEAYKAACALITPAA